MIGKPGVVRGDPALGLDLRPPERSRYEAIRFARWLKALCCEPPRDSNACSEVDLTPDELDLLLPDTTCLRRIYARREYDEVRRERDRARWLRNKAARAAAKKGGRICSC